MNLKRVVWPSVLALAIAAWLFGSGRELGGSPVDPPVPARSPDGAPGGASVHSPVPYSGLEEGGVFGGTPVNPIGPHG